MPYVSELRSTDNDMIRNLATTYENNGAILMEAMKENILGKFLLSFDMVSRPADDLIDAIKEIRSNTENLEYSLNLK